MVLVLHTCDKIGHPRSSVLQLQQNDDLSVVLDLYLGWHLRGNQHGAMSSNGSTQSESLQHDEEGGGNHRDRDDPE